MAVFVVLLLGPIMIQHLTLGKHNNINYEKKNRCALAFFFLFFTFLLVFRHPTVGRDTENYFYFFNNFAKMEWQSVAKSSFELGFAYLNKIVSVFSTNPQVFLAVVAIITVAMIYPTYRRLSSDPSLTIVLFCLMSTFVVTFSGIRQMLAVGIGFLAYECTRRKKLIPFIFCVAVAMLFHNSAFMIVFMYPLYHAKITKKWLYAVVPALLIVLVFNKQIFNSLMFVLSQYTQYEGSAIETGAYTMLVLFVIFTVFAFLIPDEKLLDKETIGLRNFLLLALILQMFAPLHTLAMRMSYYYIIFIPLLLPKIIECRSRKWDQVAVVGRHIMVVFFGVYFLVNSFLGGALDVFPYHFFWESV